MQIDANEVYTFKTGSGEEIIAQVLDPGTTWITISNPVLVAPTPQGMGLVPGLFTADSRQTVQLNTQNVVLIARTDESVRAKYIEATTGITVPGKKLIFG